MTRLKLAQEDPPPNEAAYIDDLAARLKQKITLQYPKGLMRRDAHPKMHGVVKAEFTVLPDLPDDYRVGLFAHPATYQAWIRFSNQNADIQDDNKGDIRGMAIKVMNVDGEKLEPQASPPTTQDFILISTPVFVTRDVREFDQLIAAFTGNVFSMLWFLATHWRVSWHLLLSMRKFANPLQIPYFSTTPYLFGDTACKYHAVPHPVANPDTIPSPASPDFLREAMIRQLAAGDVHVDFMVQRQTDPATMPIEDPGQAWPTDQSPYVKVATIRILQQAFDSEAQRRFGENLSFSPWHCLSAHRPLGGINRARRVVYETISRFRHEVNQVVRREPHSWDIDSPD